MECAGIFSISIEKGYQMPLAWATQVFAILHTILYFMGLSSDFQQFLQKYVLYPLPYLPSKFHRYSRTCKVALDGYV